MDMRRSWHKDTPAGEEGEQRTGDQHEQGPETFPLPLPWRSALERPFPLEERLHQVGAFRLKHPTRDLRLRM